MYPNETSYTNPYSSQQQYYAPQTPRQKPWKKIIIIGGGVLLLLLLLIWLSSASTLVIETVNAKGASPITYTITDKSGKPIKKVTKDAAFKKSLPSGAYQISVTQDGSSYLSYVKTNGFFRTTKVTAGLASESARQFVGVNPASCMYSVGTSLLSSACGLGYENLQLHKPATDNLPTVTENIVTRQMYGPLEGIAYTKFGTVALVQQSTSEDEAKGHYASLISDTLVDSNRTLLKGLDVNTAYAIKPYREGFIAYATDFSSFYYIAGLSVDPVKLTVTPPKGSAFKPYLAGVGNDALVVAYSDKVAEKIVEYAETTKNKKANMEVAVLTGAGERRFSFKQNASGALYCGTDRLCLLVDGAVQVYDISGKKPKLLYNIPGVKTMEMTQKGLMVVTKEGIQRLTAETAEGFTEYSFGKYTYCGLAGAKDGYVLCVQAPGGQKNGLLINQARRTSDTIDKKVLALSETPNISFVSPYGNYIYVVPDYGVAEYNAELGGDTYNPATVQQVNANITAAAEKLGLNKPPYKVISTGF